MSEIELNFCERGTDHSFQLTIDPTTTTVDKLFELFESEILIPPQSLCILDSEDNQLHLRKVPPMVPLSKSSLASHFVDGGLFIYYDTRFDPITTSERQYIDSLPMNNMLSQSLNSMCFNRPVLFSLFLSKHPNIHAQLIPPVTELFPVRKERAMDPESDEFKRVFSRFTLDNEHLRKYWTKRKTETPEDDIVIEELRHVEGKDVMRQQFITAMEYMPEQFGEVIMLYIPFEINDKRVACFVDSGAQTTLVSSDFARRVGIDHLIDRQFAGKASGVGTGDILGKIHSCKVKMGTEVASFSFKVVDGIDLDILLGLDNLKSHQMSINLKENCLEFNNQKIQFLSEHEIKQYQRQSIRDKTEFYAKKGIKNEEKSMNDDEVESEPNKVYGKIGTDLEDMVKFLSQNAPVITRAANFVKNRYDFDMVQQQRIANTAVRPDQSLLTDMARITPRKLATQPQQQATKGGGGAASKKAAADAATLAQKLQRFFAAGNDNANDDNNNNNNNNGNTDEIEKDATAFVNTFIGNIIRSQTQQEPTEQEIEMVKAAMIQELASKGSQNPEAEMVQIALMAQMQQAGTMGNLAGGNAAGAAQRPAQQQQQQRQLPQVDQQKLKTLVGMGFSQDDAAEALMLYSNDLDLALAHLTPDDE